MNIGMKKFSSLDLCGQGDKIVVSKSINETRAEKKKSQYVNWKYNSTGQKSLQNVDFTAMVMMR